MQKYAIDRCVEGWLKFSIVVMDSCYFDNILVKFIESKGKYWIAESKTNRLVLYNNKWINRRSNKKHENKGYGIIQDRWKDLSGKELYIGNEGFWQSKCVNKSGDKLHKDSGDKQSKLATEKGHGDISQEVGY
ncbi:MAG: hypothetical protein ACP5G5_04965 [Thermoplasmata archaeon]